MAKRVNLAEETTQEYFDRMRNNIEHFDPTQWDMSKEEMQAQYDCFKRIYETINGTEFLLLFLLRNSGLGEIRRFLDVAKKRYTAFQSFQSLAAGE